MKKNGTYLVPTLYLGDWFLDNAERLHIPPEMGCQSASRCAGGA
jgi:hypothetical protein